MCFSVNVNIIKEELEARYGAKLIDHENYRPSYYYHAHALPDLAVLLRHKDEDEIRLHKWGLIPSWIEDADEAEKIRYMTFNARAETISTKPSFADSFRSRRCLIPVAGFFEWQHTGSEKRPWYIYNPETPVISLAGLYDSWYDAFTGRNHNTFSVITTEANELLSKIHNTKKRMPLIIASDMEEKWLSQESAESELDNMMQAFPEGILRAHQISPLINNKKINRNTAKIIEPYIYPVQSNLF